MKLHSWCRGLQDHFPFYSAEKYFSHASTLTTELFIRKHLSRFSTVELSFTKLTMTFGLTIKSLCPPTWTCFFMRLKLLKRQMSRPLLFVLRLKSTSSQKYLNHNHNGRFLCPSHLNYDNYTEKCVADIREGPKHRLVLGQLAHTLLIKGKRGLPSYATGF